MEPNELEQNLTELEEKIERVRALYEQYFCGIEKIEPQIPRKDIDRRVALLRKEQIRNTAMRFKFQTLVQRYNTMQQHWGRILREIENGTYKRDVVRAAARFGVDEALTAVGRKRAASLAKGLAAQAEREKERDRRKKKPDDEYEVADEDIEAVEDDDFDDDAPTPPPMRDAGAAAQGGVGPRGTQPPEPGPGQVAMPAMAAPRPGFSAPVLTDDYDYGNARYQAPAYPAAGGYPQPSYPSPGYAQPAQGQPVPGYAPPEVARPAAPQPAVPAQPAEPAAAARGGFGEIAPAWDSAPPPAPTAADGPAVSPTVQQQPQPRVGFGGLRPAGASAAAAQQPRTGGGLRLGGGPSKKASQEALNRIASSLGDGGASTEPALRADTRASSGESSAVAAPPAQASAERPPVASPARKPLLSSPIDLLDLDTTADPPRAIPPAAPTTRLAPPPAGSRPGLRPPTTGASAPVAPRAQAAENPAPPAPAPAAPAAASSTASAAEPVSPPPSQRPAPVNPAVGPKPAPRASQARDDLSDGRLREIYSQYVQSRRERNESTAGITFEKLADSLRSQADKLKSKHTAKRVDYEVVVKDGKTLIKPIVR
ncbi:MAG: MXAN_5187 C-terminal domain-containing protein [Polyangiaceae bacterium]